MPAAGSGSRFGPGVRKQYAPLEGRTVIEWALAHDAARPCLDPADLGRLLDRLGTHPVGGLLATRVSDTLKRTARIGGGADPPVTETVARSDLWRALTPQMFRFGPLCAALDGAHAAGRFPSDEAQALEWLGERP